ncbi:uncharacterized protein LOC110774246 [Prunus avium]|uniref:Uncharacterized protein LOC110774246 n=1 Tax=Prunus avium TaxID=42229 RepID=A0A6P5U2V2_PRUAV|nr:uncharacterized protein LOC110774246 [Prunus avium]
MPNGGEEQDDEASVSKFSCLEDKNIYKKIVEVHDSKRTTKTLYRCCYLTSYKTKTYDPTEDMKKGKLVAKNFSHGAAFVEFTEHQHALVALRVLNNNPETLGPEHRPIVEFALENVKKLNIRNTKIQAQQHAAHRNWENVHQNEGSNRPDTHPSKKSKNSKQKGEKRKLDDSVPNKEDEVENKFSDGAATERQRGSKRQKK